MAAPQFIAASTGATDAGGAWTATCHAPGASGRLIILQILQDGTTLGAPALTGASNITALDGTANAWTVFTTPLAVGNPTAAYQLLYVGRSTGTSAPTATGTNSTSEDLYWRFYEFSGVIATATTVSTLIDNPIQYTSGTSNSVADIGVTTDGPDRLAINLIAVNDDNAIAQFSGQSGGTWVEVAEFAESSGTDGAIQLQYATMTDAGTIDGGTASITDSDSWGVVGFALNPSIWTTPSSFTASAVTKKTISGSFTASAVIAAAITTVPGDFTASAVILRTWWFGEAGQWE